MIYYVRKSICGSPSERPLFFFQTLQLFNLILPFFEVITALVSKCRTEPEISISDMAPKIVLNKLIMLPMLNHLTIVIKEQSSSKQVLSTCCAFETH